MSSPEFPKLVNAVVMAAIALVEANRNNTRSSGYVPTVDQEAALKAAVEALEREAVNATIAAWKASTQDRCRRFLLPSQMTVGELRAAAPSLIDDLGPDKGHILGPQDDAYPDPQT